MISDENNKIFEILHYYLIIIHYLLYMIIKNSV